MSQGNNLHVNRRFTIRKPNIKTYLEILIIHPEGFIFEWWSVRVGP